MPDSDVLVLGAGILGLTSAYYVKRDNPRLSVAVIDREREVGQGNTARSVGGYRRGLFISTVNRILSETSVDYYTEVDRSNQFNLGMRDLGYMILFTEPAFSKVASLLPPLLRSSGVRLLDEREVGQALGVVTSFDGDEEASLLGLDRIKCGLFAERCGQMDVEKLVNFYKEKCLEVGVDFILQKEASRLVLSPAEPLGIQNEPRSWQAKKFRGIQVGSEVFSAGQIILAAGAWTPLLLDPVGIECFIKSKKRQLATIRANSAELSELLRRRGLNKFDTLPMIFFPKGLYLVPRPSEGSFWVGLTDDIGRAFKIDMEPEQRFYHDEAYPMLVKYFPQFRHSRPENVWAGSYSINTVDGNPVVFRTLNCVVVTGGSGSGAMKADAIGRIAAALLSRKKVAVLHGGVPFDVSVLGVDERRVDREYLIL